MCFMPINGVRAQGYVDDLYYLSSDKKDNMENLLSRKRNRGYQCLCCSGTTVEIKERVKKPKNQRSVDEYNRRYNDSIKRRMIMLMRKEESGLVALKAHKMIMNMPNGLSGLEILVMR